MKKFLFSVLILVSCSTVEAKWFKNRRSNTTATYSRVINADNSSAQAVANWQARNNTMQHIGGNPGYEGVGMAGTSDGAIRNCCYWGKLTPVDIGVAQAANGTWYACVRYR